ncbi:MAG: zinc ribbon domain-containing protein, partial [Anaerolineales bacterium]|nr:zinc ribbon domain-containing protein [Anaerolineales bacterium]
WFGLVIGLGIMAFGAYRFWQSSREEAEALRKPTKRGRRSASGAGGTSVFCHECGTKSNPGDRFCRNCGEKLRV